MAFGHIVHTKCVDISFHSLQLTSSKFAETQLLIRIVKLSGVHIEIIPRNLHHAAYTHTHYTA